MCAQCNTNNFPYIKCVLHKHASPCVLHTSYVPFIFHVYNTYVHSNTYGGHTVTQIVPFGGVLLSHMQHLPRSSYTHQLSGTHLPQVLTLHSGVVHPQHVLCLHRPRTAPLYFCRTCPPPHCLAVGLLHAKPLVVGTAHVKLGSCLQGRILRTATLCHRQHVAKTLHLQQHTTSSSELLSYFKPTRMLSWARSYDVGMHTATSVSLLYTTPFPAPFYICHR